MSSDKPSPEDHKAMLEAAARRGWMGGKECQMKGRFPRALVEAAQDSSGVTDLNDLLTYALAKVAFEDHDGRKLLALEGTVPRGAFDCVEAAWIMGSELAAFGQAMGGLDLDTVRDQAETEPASFE